LVPILKDCNWGNGPRNMEKCLAINTNGRWYNVIAGNCPPFAQWWVYLIYRKFIEITTIGHEYDFLEYLLLYILKFNKFQLTSIKLFTLIDVISVLFCCCAEFMQNILRNCSAIFFRKSGIKMAKLISSMQSPSKYTILLVQ